MCKETHVTQCIVMLGEKKVSKTNLLKYRSDISITIDCIRLLLTLVGKTH